MTGDPLHSAAALLLVLGTLVATSVLFSRASRRFGLPLSLVFLSIGMLAGSDGIGGIAFDDYALAFRIGTAALALILFGGGLSTPMAAVREGLRAGAVLATLGVVGTAALIAVAARAFGLPWTESALLGAVVSSTDAATVFAVLRGARLNLRRRVGVTLELESGLNDPLAVILTIALTDSLVSGRPPGLALVAQVFLQAVVGLGCGLGIGLAVRALLRRVRLGASGMYPVLTVAIAMVAFGAPTLLRGSGFLAVYVAGVVIGNGPLPFRAGIVRVQDSISWLAQVSMFLLLGLLVFPSRLPEVAAPGIGIALVLAFVARPLVVALCLLPLRYSRSEIAYVGWVGLRGAVPIVLAIFPVLAGAPGAERLFDIVFFVVVVNALVPGSTISWVTRRLGVDVSGPPPPPATIEISSSRVLAGEVLPFYVDQASAVCGSRIADLPFPEGAVVMLLLRGSELVAPKGSTVLAPGDHVYVFAHEEDTAFLRLLFGTQEEA